MVKKVAKKPIKKTVGIHEGDVVSNFILPATGNKDVSLESLRGQFVVLYFYPKDCTPGCTIEGHEFTKLHKQFKKLNVEIFGISRDSIKMHEKFKTTEKYSFDLLSDAEEQVCELFGVMKLKNMYGKQVRGIERSTFVIDPAGRLIKEWRGVKVDGHAKAVFDFIKDEALCTEE